MAQTATLDADGRSGAHPRVRIRPGWLEGVRRGGVACFLGVPYAEPPVGELRFRAPKPLGTWEGVRTATALGPQCIQNNPDLPAWLDPSPESEDCLVLNVWTPIETSEPLPIMVWLHGGGFTYGSAGVPVYDGARLAGKGNVVVVSVNHRLNVFGYAWFGDLVPELAEDANPGQRDIELALRWVRENSAAFGGDPGNVTVFGQSGGGGKISALCASPTGRGLFDKMVIQSGAPARVYDRAEATEIAELLLRNLDISEPTASALHEVGTEQLKTAAAAVEAERGVLAFQPVVDGGYLTDHLWSDRVLQHTAHIPLLIGTTADETAASWPGLGAGEPNFSDLVELLGSVSFSPSLGMDEWTAVIEEYRRLMPGLGVERLAVAATTDLSFGAVARHVLGLRAGAAAGTFAYQFAWQTPCFGSAWSPHSAELPFVFGNLDYPSAWDGNDNEEIRAAADPDGARFPLSDAMILAWTTFARLGDPSTTDIPWKRWSSDARPTMVIDQQGWRTVEGLADDRWERVRSRLGPRAQRST
jgi:para-nitrobenzyl esterase